MDEQTILTGPDIAHEGSYTYADYYSWTCPERYELIKGKVFKNPTPHTLHQIIVGNILGPIGLFLKDSPYKIFSAPFDVRLLGSSQNDEDITTVVQPDLSIFCKREHIDERGGIGAPDIAIEVLSPGNNVKELRYKYEVYEEAGVSEYWVVSPDHQLVMVYNLEAGVYKPSRPKTNGDIITTPILPGFELDLDELFNED